MSQTVVLKVAMSCSGCSGAVQRALGKMEGVESFDVNLKEQKVTVTGNVQPEAVFETVSKTGKKTAYWEEPISAPAPEVAPAPTTEAAQAITETAEAAASEPASAPEPAPAPAPVPAPAPQAVEGKAEAKTAEPVPVPAA
ncbi:hypothetical protein V2J09_001259 [Rumex salicifolius]